MLPVTDWRGKRVESLVPACSSLWAFPLILYFFKDLTKAKGQPGINLEDIVFLSSPLHWSLKCVVLPVPPPLRSHRATVTHRRLSLWWIGVTWLRLSPAEEKRTVGQGRRRISISTISQELMSFSELRSSVLLKHAFHNASFTCKPCKTQPLVGCFPLHRSPSYHTAAAVCVVFEIHRAWWQPVGRENNVFYLFRVKHSLNSILNK